MAFPARLFPTPVAVALQLWEHLTEGRLLSDLGKTLTRAFIAFAIAMLLGTAIGIGLGRSRLADRLFSSWLVIGLNLPAIVIAIMLYIWLGLTEFALILAVARIVADFRFDSRRGARSRSELEHIATQIAAASLEPAEHA